MNENEKLIDAIIDLGTGMKEVRQEIKGMRSDMNRQLGDLNYRVDKLEKQQAKTNLQLAEHTRSILKLAEQQEKTNTKLETTNSKLETTNSKLDGLRTDFNKYAVANDTRIIVHEKRIVRLENIAGYGGKETFMVKEPGAKYEKKKRKS